LSKETGLNRKMLVTAIAAILVVSVAVSEVFVFSLFSTKSAFATGANTPSVALTTLAPTSTALAHTSSNKTNVTPTITKGTTNIVTSVSNKTTCPDRTEKLNLKPAYTIPAQQVIDLGTQDVSCFSLLRLVAINHGPNDVQLTLTIVDEVNPALSTVLASELLGSGAPPLTDAFELPGKVLNISAVTTGATKNVPSSIEIALYGHV
jgi:hypothetical protein